MYIITGGAGFIGSVIVWKLNQLGIDDIVIVDDLGETEKWKNLVNRKYRDYVHKDKFLEQIKNDKLPSGINTIIHMGACSSTTEKDADYLTENNYRYSKSLAEYSLVKDIRFIYASSAATYGDGTLGFSDNDELIPKLKPMNMYGYSKQMFDLWVLNQGYSEKFVGLKFFNVFGPNEYHKGDMSSVIFKAFHQIQETGKVRLFKSYKPEYKDGEQRRDFVYVKDCMELIWWLTEHKEVNGIFNLGTGEARTWLDLTNGVFGAMQKETKIEFIEMPEFIQPKYQYFTEATMSKLKETGCPVKFQSLENAIKDYVQNHLMQSDPYL